MSTAGTMDTTIACNRFATDGVAAGESGEQDADALAIQDEHREDRARLDDDHVGVSGVLGGRGLANIEYPIGHHEMPGRADRQILGEAFDDAEDDRIAVRQASGDGSSSRGSRSRSPH